MKRNFTISQNINKFILLLFIAFFVNSNFAQTISEYSCSHSGTPAYSSSCGSPVNYTGYNIQLHVDYDPCDLPQGNVRFHVRQVSGGSDYMIYYDLKVNGTVMYHANKLFSSPLSGNFNNGYEITNEHPNVVAHNAGGLITAQYWASPIINTAIDANNRFSLTVDGRWQTGCCGYGNFVETKVYQLHFADNASSLTATPGCQSIILNWNNGAYRCANSSGLKTFIYRSNTPGGTQYYIGEVDYNTTTFTETNAGFTRGYNYSYHVKHGYNIGGSRRFDNIASVNNAQVKNYFTPPANFKASKDECDATILLTWDNVSNSTGYKIYRDNVLIKTITAGTINDYLDDDPVLVRGQNYTYHIQTGNDCDHYSPLSFNNPNYFSTDFGISPKSPTGPANVWLDNITSTGLEVRWNTDVEATGGYDVETSFIGGGGLSTFHVDAPDTTYQDNNLNVCQSYVYRILAINDCVVNSPGIPGDSLRYVKLLPDLSAVFDATSFDASKGYFPNRIELTWNVQNNENNINAFKIYRKILGSNLDSILISSQNSGTNIYQDNLTDAGVLYEYFIIAERQCEQETVYSNIVSSIGFRSVTGVIAGQVNYTGGIAVKDVKIEATNSNGAVGNSLLLSGNDSIVVNDNNNFEVVNELTAELYFNPQNLNDYTLIEKENEFSVKHIGANLVFEVFNTMGVSQVLSIPDTSINLNAFNQLTATIYDDTMKLYVNNFNIAYSLFTDSIQSNTNPIVLASGLQGNIDEIRFWNVGKDSTQVFKDYSRQLNGLNANLKFYYRVSENYGDFLYDYSRTSNSAFNKNHGQIFGSFAWSTDIPLSTQLTNATYTNAQGNYFLSVPYGGIGETFVVAPFYQTHSFSPSTRALFVGDGSAVHNNIDFEDISSFQTAGYVKYKNSTCFVEGATVKVDGDLVVDINGNPVKTNIDGFFDIRVPIGPHYISVEKEGHTFEVDRFPYLGRFDFQVDGTLLEFTDTTSIKVVGRVAGGLREGNKFVGLHNSKNNIGVARIQFLSQNDCDTLIVFTDVNSGEYTANVLPFKYKMAVSIPSNPALDFGTLDLVDLDAIPDMVMYHDSLGYDSLNMTAIVDSVSYQRRLDYNYRSTPILDVFSYDYIGTSLVPFFGDSVVNVVDYNAGSPSFTIPASVFPFGVFKERHTREDFKYKAQILAYEPYVNKDIPNNYIQDTVPVTDGKLIIDNDLALEPEYAILMKDVVTDINELTYVVYDFTPGQPSFLENTTNPAYSYTQKFYLALETANGTVIPWLPITNPMTGLPDVYRGYMIGGKSSGFNNFFTQGPETVDYVLRDPPGDGSFATRQIGQKSSTSDSWNWDLGIDVKTVDNVYLGSAFSSGIGVAVTTDVQNNYTFGSQTTVSGGKSGSITKITENTSEWITSSASESIGSSSDIFIGKSTNVEFGISDFIKLVPDSMCNSINCIDSFTNGYAIAKTSTLSLVPGGYSTGFMYTQEFIETTLLPDLINLRNVFLQTSTKHTPNPLIPFGHENYGKNNDDLVFGTNASSETPSVMDIPQDYTGESYTYVPVNAQDSLIDSLRLLNQQINLWEKAIWRNEFEKINIENNVVINNLKLAEVAKLDAQYQANNTAYLALTIANPAIGLIGFGASFIPAAPGASAITSATFIATTSIKIAASELIQRRQEYLNKRAAIDDRYNNLSAINHSISGGVSFTSSMNSQVCTANAYDIEFGGNIALHSELQSKVSNIGIGASKNLSLNFSSSNTNETVNNYSSTVSYTLNDANNLDNYSVDVYPSMYGWGPIFKRRSGGQTSCPYEPGEVTRFYEPGEVLHEPTFQRDKPGISVDQPIITNVPVDQQAVFTLTLENLSETNEDMEYIVKAISAQNPFGALITINGAASQTLLVPGSSSINLTLAIGKGPGGTYDYEDLLIVAQSICQDDIVDSVYVTAKFLPTCTDVELLNPSDNWILNNSFLDTLPLIVSGYDINFYDLNRFRIEYKASNEPNWIGLQSYWKDTTGQPTFLPIPTNDFYTLYDWDVHQVNDGNYDVRITSICDLAEVNSQVYSGIMDRINPHPFGTPSPGDGILDPNDDISIRFNENVDFGSLTSLNFDVRGVLNQTTLSHAASLYFDGIDDEVEVLGGANIQNRDFTIEFWAKRDGLGEQVIFSQGNSPLENLSIGFNAANSLSFKLGTTEITSINNVTDNLWHHYAVSYDFDSEAFAMYFDATLVTAPTQILGPNFVNTDALVFGKNAATNSNFFKGNLHEVRVWNVHKSVGQISANMNTILSSSALSLLYNWQMDEADGQLVKDHVRRRDGILSGAAWQINPNGNAIELDGLDDYILIDDMGNVAITEEMDFTLEFWYNSTSTDVETMFSNGMGDGIGADSLISWNIQKDASGQIHVLHNGIDFIAVNNNTFDGEWHHFALVLNRTGSLTSYVDGNIQNSMQALNIRQFGGNKVYLGARGSLISPDQHFTGKLDEFRFWNTARKVEQVTRDKQFRMLGDEMGLVSYLPFEEYQLVAGFPVLTNSNFDLVDNTHTVSVLNGGINTTNTPKIKIQRPVQNILHTYSVNGDEIIITPTLSQELIENITLDITVSSIKDLNGNNMQSPKTWIAYIDKNQVVWQDDVLSFEKAFGETLIFTTAVINNGGSAKVYDITNLPDWLTASQTTGSIAPNSVEQVTFTIDANINIGDYLQDLHLLTDFGFPEKLTIELKVRTPEPEWNIDPANYTNSMSIIGYVAINDVVSTSEEDILSVFVNDTCRGSAHLQYVPQLDRYLVFLDVYSNVNNGENLTFKVWDASSGTIFSEIAPDTLSFVANTLIGSTSAPQLFETSYEIEVAIPLNTGWNWVSHFLLNPDSLDLDKTLESLESVTGDEIKGISNFSNYLANTGWVGSLNQVGILPEDGYKLKVSQIDTLLIKGDIIDPTSRTIDLAQGWNWIGFISVRNQSVTQALGNLNPTDGDIIKAQSQFAVYDNLLGWVGSLQTMKPGTGYMYYTTNAASFVYPAIGQFKSGIVSANEIYKSKKWTVENGKYASNMTLISSLDTDCEYIENNENIAIGVFDEDENCRAVNLLENLEENQYSFLTVGGKSSAKLNFGIMDTKTGRNYDLAESIQFSSNERKGTITEPFMLKISDEVCFKMEFENGVGEEIAENVSGEGLIEVYPTVFEDEINVYFFTKEPSEIKQTLKLYNLWGQLVYEQNFQEEKGYNKVSFDVSKKTLSVGVYHLIISDEESKIHSFKIVKK